MALPEKYHLDAIRKLRGDAMVTHPDAAIGVRRIERVFTVPRGTPEDQYVVLTDQEYASAVLVEQYIVGGDEQNTEVFRAWEDMPGTPIPSERVNDRGDIETTITQRVLTGTDPDADGLLVVSSGVQAIDNVKATKTTATVASYSTLTRKEYSDEAQGEVVTHTDQIVIPSTALPAGGLLLLGAQIEQTTKTKARLTQRSAASFPVLTDYEQASDLQSLITTTRQIVAAGTTITSTTVGISESIKAIDKWRSLRTRRTYAVPTSRKYYQRGSYRFPALLYGAVGAIYTDPDSGEAKLTVNYTLRPAFSALVSFRVIETFYTAEPPEPTDFSIRTKDYSYSGIRFNVSVNDVLCDGGFDLTYTSGALTETYTFDASPTTLTDYVAMVTSGAWYTIGLDAPSIWEAGIWRSREHQVRMQ